MSQGVWDTLGIEPTKDIKKIKHAYAAASKKYHPEEHPEEFERLQKAYKEALQYAKSEREAPQEPEPVIKSESIPAPKPEPKSDPKPKTKSEPKPEPEPEQKTGPGISPPIIPLKLEKKPEPEFVSPPAPKPEQPQVRPKQVCIRE